ncbi:uncharacterized protein LOC130900254 [Diorhabda carinulata]|uniref:uncharacterized protein LOC130900254 n=1 Tax=Diorhabda carinulata TaxID=1163345 RepID=UPI0025A126D9|nr:uncharacterized protein LOC130900254 [Diorhabda carinulata]
MNIITSESELLTDWLEEMFLNEKLYLEPQLDRATTILVKDVCNLLRHDNHVFAFSVDTLEEYIRRKAILEEEIDDPALTVVVTIFICGKVVGIQDVKIKILQNILRRMTGRNYHTNIIKQKEMEILKTFDYSLPINNDVDDLKTFISKFETQSCIRVSIISLCCEILEALYITRSHWFYSLKNMYIVSNEALEVFKKLMQSRLYLPIGILISAFRITSYKNTLNVDKILEDLANGSQIHTDHFNALISKIIEIINE